MNASRVPKQAVVLIHGIGEPVPMDTLHGFVNAVWTTDSSLRGSNVPSTAWSKPDNISEDYELRRLTTAENHQGKQTDFFEFYWADHMSDTRIGHVTAWIKVLLLRRPSRVPAQLRGLWWFLVILAILLAVGAAIYKFDLVTEPKWLVPTLGVIGLVAWIGASGFLITYAGDAARYLHVAPPNIGARRKIREAGIKLIQKLHESKKYDRIIVVGHSLGTVIGYDILTHLWPRYYYQHVNKPPPSGPVKLDRAEDLARQKPDASFAPTFQTAQSEYLGEIHGQTNQWLVTDFVTMGSPLAHASVLMVRNVEEFNRKKAEREFPTCPPFLETVAGQERFSFKPDEVWVPHHAAVFAVTRWTNLYFPCRFTLWGDVIGGPVAPAFGPGVRDVPVVTNIFGGIFSHTAYWKTPADQPPGTTPSHIAELRKAVRICITK